jgi:hypothetical protein
MAGIADPTSGERARSPNLTKDLLENDPYVKRESFENQPPRYLDLRQRGSPFGYSLFHN